MRTIPSLLILTLSIILVGCASIKETFYETTTNPDKVAKIAKVVQYGVEVSTTQTLKKYPELQGVFVAVHEVLIVASTNSYAPDILETILAQKLSKQLGVDDALLQMVMQHLRETIIDYYAKFYIVNVDKKAMELPPYLMVILSSAAKGMENVLNSNPITLRSTPRLTDKDFILN
jgi:uncharacterized lipoprotein YmbA